MRDNPHPIPSRRPREITDIWQGNTTTLYGKQLHDFTLASVTGKKKYNPRRLTPMNNYKATQCVQAMRACKNSSFCIQFIWLRVLQTLASRPQRILLGITLASWCWRPPRGERTRVQTSRILIILETGQREMLTFSSAYVCIACVLYLLLCLMICSSIFSLIIIESCNGRNSLFFFFE